MTTLEQKQRELQAAIDGFSSCLRQIEAGNLRRLENELEKERALIGRIRVLTSQGCFFRAFSQAEWQQLMDRLEHQQLEMGRCAPQLQALCDLIESRLEQQRHADERRLAAIQKTFSSEEYEPYARMFRSDIFLNYLSLDNRQ